MVHSEQTTDVLIVGAGPTGLMAANELLHGGVDFTIIEKREAPSIYSKALGIQPRSLEALDRLGLAETFIKQSFLLPGAKFHLEKAGTVTVELSQLDSRFPYLCTLPQSETERILEEHLNHHEVTVQRQWELNQLSQTEDGVTATVNHAEGTTQIKARYVLACDGSHSPVRKALGISFLGKKDNISFALGDVSIEGLEHGYLNAFLTERGIAAFFPFKEGHFRVITIDFSKMDQSHHKELPLEELQNQIDHLLPGRFRLSKPRWLARFGTDHRQIPSYRTGSTFFLGDAAHIHNPIGGQGMNLGLQDASNLAWKLALVLSHQAPPSLLDTYHTERYPVAQQIIKTTTQALKTMTIKPPWTLFRNWLGIGALSTPIVQKKFINNLSNLSISYRSAPHIATQTDHSLAFTALQAGDRIPHIHFLDRDYQEIRLHSLLQQHRFLALLYTEVADQSTLSDANAWAQAIREQFGDLITPFLVARAGNPTNYDNQLPTLFDLKNEAANKIGMRERHLIVIRPDGHLVFHQSTFDIPSSTHKLSTFIQLKKI
ncbi:FAD-dependent monooxygenase [Marininema halotolerans]|uniref:2-polyprenyl-6-methoxyphenol hydroxylase n=1 Tax=Marininema halotolerans TaxID=1155944 RepID=A0A1I6UKE0_9BACL|nr:FAD-dependent monooxygenase [Marininema halotolerans]SFT01893.1 2-polyprenyl-6-methoxyphenol hydroxylase [Marininema halotolerans]